MTLQGSRQAVWGVGIGTDICCATCVRTHVSVDSCVLVVHSEGRYSMIACTVMPLKLLVRIVSIAGITITLRMHADQLQQRRPTGSHLTSARDSLVARCIRYFAQRQTRTRPSLTPSHSKVRSPSATEVTIRTPHRHNHTVSAAETAVAQKQSVHGATKDAHRTCSDGRTFQQGRWALSKSSCPYRQCQLAGCTTVTPPRSAEQRRFLGLGLRGMTCRSRLKIGSDGYDGRMTGDGDRWGCVAVNKVYLRRYLIEVLQRTM